MIQVEHMVIPRSWEVCVWKGDELVLQVSVWVGLSWAVPLILPGTAPAAQTSCSLGCWLLTACYHMVSHPHPGSPRPLHSFQEGKSGSCQASTTCYPPKQVTADPHYRTGHRVEKAAKEAATSNLPQILKVISKRGTKRI